MKCSCGNFKLKHLPEDPHARYTSVFNEQSTSPITGTVCNIYSSPLKDFKPSGKSELIKGGSERALAAAERSVN